MAMVGIVGCSTISFVIYLAKESPEKVGMTKHVIPAQDIKEIAPSTALLLH